MKTIKLPKHASFQVKLDGSVCDTHKVRDNHIAYTENAREVIFSAATIEGMLKDYVTNFFVADDGKIAMNLASRNSSRSDWPIRFHKRSVPSGNVF